jgi:cell division protein FtsB
VEEQLAAARASLAALTAERQQREQEAAALQAKCNEYMAIR